MTETTENLLLPSLFNNLEEVTKKTSPETTRITSYLPWTEESAHEYMQDYKDKPYAFRNGLQQIVNFQSETTPLVMMEGLHGSGKTSLIENLKNEIPHIFPVKMSGFVDEDEMEQYKLNPGSKEKYPGLWEVAGERIHKIAQMRKKGQKLEKGLSLGDSSWHALQKVYFYHLDRLWNQPDSLLVADRGFATRLQHWEKDPNKKFEANPFITEYSHPLINPELGEKYGIKREDFQVYVPLPTHTIFLFAPIYELTARLLYSVEEGVPKDAKEEILEYVFADKDKGFDINKISGALKKLPPNTAKAVEANLKDFWADYGLLWKLDDMFGKEGMDKMSVIYTEAKNPQQVTETAIDILKEHGVTKS